MDIGTDKAESMDLEASRSVLAEARDLDCKEGLTP